MRIPRPHSRIPGRAWAGSLLLATIAAASVTAGPAAIASPLSGATRGHLDQASGVTGAQPKPGQVTWSVLPATAKGPDYKRSLFSYGVVKPGSSIVDHVEIINHSKQSAAFSIYATDATGTTLQDALLLEPPGKKPVDIGAWVTFPGGAAQLSAVIPASTAVIESFTVNVPQLATPGDHTGGLVGQVGIPEKNSAGMAIIQTYRIAVPVELRVSGALHAAVQVQSISTGFNDPFNPFGNGSATISYSVANTGNVRQTGTQAVTVTGPFGQKVTVQPPKLPTILPGDSVRVTANLPGLFPAGPMTAHVTVAPGWPARTISLPGTLPLANGTASLFAVPWSLVGLILLLVAIGVGVWWFLRWRRREHRAEVAAAAARARQETERRLLGSNSAAGANGQNGQGADGHPAPVADNGATGVAASGGQESGSTPE